MKLHVNGRALEVQEDTTVLQAARLARVEVPTICHHDRLRPAGACRLCLVKVKRVHHFVPACVTPVADAMEVETHTPGIEETRRTLLRLLVEDYPVEAAERWPEKPFHGWLSHYQVSVAADVRRLISQVGNKESETKSDQNLPTSAVPAPFRDAAHPCLAADMSHCIDCFHCVSTCNEVQGQFVWHVTGPVHNARIEPGNFTGFVPLDQGRDAFEAVWQAPISPAPGQNLMQMMDAAADQKLKALWAIGYDVALTNPNTAATKAALAGLDFVVVQDLFLNDLAREFGRVLLPACSSFEKDGTFMNSERRVQRVRQAMEFLGHSKPDWVIIYAVAKAMGFQERFDFRSPEGIWNEVRAAWKAGAGIGCARLEQAGLQWPCPIEDHPGTAILHTTGFQHGHRAPLKRVEFNATTETPNAEFPFLLTTGRTLYQFNAGT